MIKKWLISVRRKIRTTYAIEFELVVKEEKIIRKILRQTSTDIKKIISQKELPPKTSAAVSSHNYISISLRITAVNVDKKHNTVSERQEFNFL